METPNKTVHPILGFYPSWDTCYLPHLFLKKQCDKCRYRPYVYCDQSPNYEKMKDEYQNQEKSKK